MKSFKYLAAAIIIAQGCKSSKITTQEAHDSDLDSSRVTQITESIDSVYLITSSGDTLSSLDEEVDISLTRLTPETFSIMAVGDIMMGTNFPDPSYLPDENGSYLWKTVKPILRRGDVTFGNLEGTILNEGGEQKECNNPKLCYLFRSPEYLAQNLIENGFDVMSLANNHANDFGETGRINTQRVLDSLNISHAGSAERPFAIIKTKKLKVGFCAFAPNRGTQSIHDLENIQSILSHLDSLTDIIVVSLHFGAEGSKHRHITREREYYYGEDRGNPYELTHQMIEMGADVIIGHGPHIVRAVEVYNRRIIAYSLGNFLTYGRFNLRNYAGEAPILEISVDQNGEFLSGKIHSFRQSYDFGPQIDTNLSSIKSIQQLSLEDFPENPIIIEDSGEIRYLDY
jgi:hypothetical protein